MVGRGVGHGGALAKTDTAGRRRRGRSRGPPGAAPRIRGPGGRAQPGRTRGRRCRSTGGIDGRRHRRQNPCIAPHGPCL
ncbi:hypothetical protein [Lysobacter gummosus]|uniref:hypothetical protein n=1 Tax=Lysobacter gummosus TaxID=262324 RepID=UPI00362FD6C0